MSRKEEYDKLKSELVRLKQKYGVDFDDWILAPYCLDEKCPCFNTETVYDEYEEEEVELVACIHYNNGCCSLPLDKFEGLVSGKMNEEEEKRLIYNCGFRIGEADAKRGIKRKETFFKGMRGEWIRGYWEGYKSVEQTTKQ